MFGTKPAFSAVPLTLAGVLALVGCGGSGGAATAGQATTTPAARTSTGAQSATNSTAGSGSTVGTGGTPSTGGTGAAGCDGGLTGAEPGVVRIVCDGTAVIHVQAGSVVKQFTGGECAQAGDLWSATDGVITEAGVYKGPPVDVVSVNKDSNGGGTIQLMLDGKNLFVEGATLTLSAGGKQARLHGTSTALSDVPKLPVTVDVTC